MLFSLVWQTRPLVQHRSFCIKINGHTDLWSCVLLVSQLTSSGRSSEMFQSTHTLRLFVFSIKAFTSTASSIKCPVLCSRTLPSPAQLYRFSVSPSPTIKHSEVGHSTCSLFNHFCRNQSGRYISKPYFNASLRKFQFGLVDVKI